MFWWILLGVSIVLTILGIVFWAVGANSRYYYGGLETTGIFFTIIFGFIVLIMALVIPLVSHSYKQEIATFEQQKHYIENVVPTLPTTDNYAITLKRIELNEWLYGAKYSKTHYSFFSLYPDEVLELEEIK